MASTMRVLVAFGLLVTACGPSVSDYTDASNGRGDGSTSGADARWTDAPPVALNASVYAHSSGSLYKVDPDTLAVSLVAPFTWSNGTDQMTDIALDKDGNMTGISFDAVYSVNKDTAEATYLAPITGNFNGLSYVSDTSGGDPREILVAAGNDGNVFEINPLTGASTLKGNYGGGYTSSGDIVSVRGLGAFATVDQGLTGNDFLARVNTTNYSVTIIGDTGFTDIWGIAFWGDKVYGFTENRQFVLIDINTGAATPVEMGAVNWWGAGVTTSAPVIE